MFIAGHITIGGSICMQMLTRSGWTPSNDIEVCSFELLIISTSFAVADPGSDLRPPPPGSASDL